jgi:hypothetical protein
MAPDKNFGSALISVAWPLVVVAAVLAAGCGSRTVQVEVPPRMNLGSTTIGMINLAAVPPDKLSQFTTQRFMAAVQAGQPGVRFLELGTMDQVLRAAGRDRIDPEAIRIIGQRHKVDSVFTGSYEISDAKPKVSVERDAVRASARVHISMTARLWDTRDGATVWTNARNGDWPVARLRMEAGQPVAVSLSDPEERYGDFMRQLVRAVTEDFRPRYETRPATK